MNLRNWKGNIALVVIWFTLVLAGCGAPQSTPATIPHSHLADWMAPVPGTKKITELSIPGTHDAGALHEHFPNTAKCQDLTISDQLLAGVRFLDIRCRHVHDQFQIYHGSVNQEISFADVVSDCLAFMKLHPGECIIMSVKEEYTPEGNTRKFEQTFDTYTAQHPGQWFLADAFPNLNEVRGKIILFRRFAAEGLPKGIAASDWPDNTTFWIGQRLRVQDDYVVKDKASKWAAIQAQYQEAITGSPDVLYVNFGSGYEPGWMGIPNLRTVADFINPQLTAYWEHARPERLGITLMDFADAQKCSLLIGTNPP